MAFRPDFITCTYGAGGSTRDKTLDVVEQVQRRFGCRLASHLTCVGSTVEQLRDYLAEAARRKIDNIVALRGDPPQGETQFQPVAGGFSYANELVALVRGEFPQFGVAVAGYPETHHEAPSPEADLANLRRKVDAGADVVITQLFYDNDDFWRFRDRCERAGIRVPIVPGMLPVTNLAQIQRIASLCGATLAGATARGSGAVGRQRSRGSLKLGSSLPPGRYDELVERGVPGIHFYVLNKSPATGGVLSAVALGAAPLDRISGSSCRPAARDFFWLAPRPRPVTSCDFSRCFSRLLSGASEPETTAGVEYSRERFDPPAACGTKSAYRNRCWRSIQETGSNSEGRAFRRSGLTATIVWDIESIALRAVVSRKTSVRSTPAPR